ncbi:hypothetical protein NUW54_g2305 [Trametes sanguinea]|uniref:Uncharacterized protein n=1 Tax=Trametes sanguinea TaxID=158606 RepID=A0ACC1Q5U6_9APHY|nr:hypothetical protein NUW54_g2305 [Trametes sanguinea]
MARLMQHADPAKQRGLGAGLTWELFGAIVAAHKRMASPGIAGSPATLASARTSRNVLLRRLFRIPSHIDSATVALHQILQLRVSATCCVLPMIVGQKQCYRAVDKRQPSLGLPRQLVQLPGSSWSFLPSFAPWHNPEVAPIMRFVDFANVKVLFAIVLGVAAVHARALPDATETATAKPDRVSLSDPLLPGVALDHRESGLILSSVCSDPLRARMASLRVRVATAYPDLHTPVSRGQLILAETTSIAQMAPPDNITIQYETNPDEKTMEEAARLYIDLSKDDQAFEAAVAGRHDLAWIMANGIIRPMSLVSGELYTAKDDKGELVGFTLWTPPGRDSFDTPDQLEIGFGDFMSKLDEGDRDFLGRLLGEAVPAFVDGALGIEKAKSTGAVMGLLTQAAANVAKYEHLGFNVYGQESFDSPWASWTFYCMARRTSGDT